MDARVGAGARPWLRRELSGTIALAWPLIVANLAQTAMTTTDLIMLGRLSPEALAGGALGYNLFLPFLLFGVGLIGAVAAIVSNLLGADPHDVAGVRRAAHQSFLCALALCAPMWLALWNARPILIALGESADVAALAATYLHGLQWSLAPAFMFFAVRSVYSALGRSNPTLLAGVLAIGVNAVGNWALIFGHLGLPALGVLGSGLATFASQCFMLAVLIGYGALDRRVAHFALFARPFRFDAAGQRALWRLGAPIGVAITIEILIFSTTVVLMGLISDADLEAHAIVFQIASVAFMIPLGLSQAATVRVGHAYGALDRRGVMRAGRVSLAITLAMMTGTAAAMLIAPRTFIAVFIDVSARANSEVLARAESFLRVAALFQIADGAQAVVSGMLRGVQDTRAPMWIAIAGYWGVGIPLGSALGFGTSLRGLGLWIGLAVGLACVAALLVLRWAARERAGFPPTILIDAEPQSYGAV